MTYHPEYRLIPGEGPTSPGGLMAIGEAGGEWENLKGRPFAGKSGWLLDTYLAKNLIPRHRIFVTNVYNAWTGPGNPTPTTEQIEFGSQYLLRDLKRIKPNFVLALGRTAAQWLIKQPITLEVSHGLPISVQLCLRCGARTDVVYRNSQAPSLGSNQKNKNVLDLDRRKDSGRLRDNSLSRKEKPSPQNRVRDSNRKDSTTVASIRSPLSNSILRESGASRIRNERGERTKRLSVCSNMQERSSEIQEESPTSSNIRSEAKRDVAVSSVCSGYREETSTETSCCERPEIHRLILVPAYHPAAALRDPETSGKTFYDISQFSLIARGLLRPAVPTDVAPNPTYTLRDKVCIEGPDPAVDTEGFTDSPYCLSYSNRDGQATVVMAKDVVRGEPLNLSSSKITFHHSMHDIPVLRAMGFKLDSWGFDDTILMARLLLLEPAGLKDLALRHAGMKMRTYDEVVGPYFQKAVRKYILRSAKIDWGKPDAQAIKNKKTGKWAIYQPQPISNRLKAIVRDLQAGKTIDLKARWEKIAPSLRAPVEERLGQFPINHPRLAPLEELVQYSGRDPDATRRVKSKLWPMIVARKLKRAYYTDLHSIPMFERMAANGMQIDPDHFSRMRPAIVEKLEESGKDWCHRFNSDAHLSLASGDQIAEYLFNRCGLKPIRQTRGGTRPSVDEKTLELLKDQHPSIPPLMAWRKLATNLSFVDRIPKWMRADHRIYPNINTQGTVTGRPSTSDPNLLNVPVRTELGKQIRMGFIAPPGKRLLSVDLSQIELRIGAHLSQDKEMMRAFKKGEDLHQRTADLLGISRYIAKTINFGIFYGMSWLRLHSELLEANAHPAFKPLSKYQDCPYCTGVIREWFKLFRGVKSWLSDLLAGARRRGYVRGLSGRLRYLPNLYMREGSPLRSEAERHAGNFPVQEGAGWVIKRAMRRMWKWIEAHPEAKVEPLLQIYDELLFEVPKLSAPAMSKVFSKMMVADEGLFSVPLKADSAVGRNWGSL